MQRQRKSPRVAQAVALAVSGLSSSFAIQSAQAVNRTWANSGTDFNTSSNWVGGNLPTSADFAVFGPAAQTAAPNVSAPLTISGLTFQDNPYTLSSTDQGTAKLTLSSTSTVAGSSAMTFTSAVALSTVNTNISTALVLGQGSGNTATLNTTSIANSTVHLSGNISESTAGTNLRWTPSQATNALTLSGNNSYSGTTQATAGRMNINSATALGNSTLLLTNTTTYDNTTGSAITLSNNNNLTYSAGTPTFALTNDLSFGSGTLQFNANLSLAVTGATLTVGSLNADTTARTFTKTGAGTLAITNAASSNFQGGTTISTGTVLLGNKSALGTGPIALNGATIGATADLSSTGTGPISNALTFTSNSIVGGSNNIEFSNIALGTSRTLTNVVSTTGSAKLTLSSATSMLIGVNTTTSATFTLNGSGNTLISGNLLNNVISSGTSGVTHSGHGALTLSGTGNTFTGALTIDSGTALITGNNTAVAPSIALSGGNTTFDLSAGNDRWNTGTVPTLRGGTLTIKGASTGTSSQTLASPTFAFSHSKIVVDSNGGSGTTLTLGSTWGEGGSVLIDLSAAGSTLTSSPTLSNSLVIKGMALVKDSSGIGFATRSGGGTGTSIVRYTGATVLPLASNLSSSTNYIQTNGGAVTLTGSNASQVAYTLQIDSTTSGNSLDLNTKSLSFGSGAANAILVTGTQDYTISNGTLGSPGTGTSLRFAQYNPGTLNVSANIGVTASTITKFGPGTVNLTGTSTHTGGTNIREGALQFLPNQSNLGTGTLQLTGGVLQSSGTFSRALGSADGQVRWTETNSNSGTGGGFAAKGGTYNIQIGGTTGSIAWAAGSFVQNGKALIFGSTSADNLVDFQNGLDFGGLQRDVTVVDNTSVSTDKARLSGVITSTNTNGGLLKTGNGVLELTNANTYAGTTVVRSGTLLVNNSTGSGTGTGAVTVNSTATLGGSGTLSGSVTIDAGAFHSPGNSPGIQTIGGNLAENGTYQWEFDNAGAIGTAGTNFDQIVQTNASATTTLSSGTFNVSLITGDYTGSFWNTNRAWKVIDVANENNLNATFASITSTGSAGQGTFTTSLGTTVGVDKGDIYLNWTASAGISTISLTANTPGGFTNRADGTPASDLDQASAGVISISGAGNQYTSETDDLQNAAGTDDYNKASATISQAVPSPVYAMFWLTGEDATSLEALRASLDGLTDVEAYTNAALPSGGELANYNSLAANYSQYGGWDLLVKLHDSANGGTSLNWDFSGQASIFVDKIAVVPEPTAISAIGIGAAGLLLGRRRRRA